jgi:hypothetical protein
VQQFIVAFLQKQVFALLRVTVTQVVFLLAGQATCESMGSSGCPDAKIHVEGQETLSYRFNDLQQR